jgi:hypothetical protein
MYMRGVIMPNIFELVAEDIGIPWGNYCYYYSSDNKLFLCFNDGNELKKFLIMNKCNNRYFCHYNSSVINDIKGCEIISFYMLLKIMPKGVIMA